MPDRRCYPRIPYGAWVEDVTEGGLGFFLAKNLSMGGLMLCANQGVPSVGHKVRLRLVVENERQVVTIKGEVIHHASGDEKDFGVRFLDLEEPQRRFIEGLMAEDVSDSDIAHGS